MNFSAKTHVLPFIPPPHQTSHQALAIVFSSMALRSVPSAPFHQHGPSEISLLVTLGLLCRVLTSLSLS